MSTKEKIFDLVIVLLIILLAGVLSVVFDINPIISTLLYYIPPTVYLFARRRKNPWKILAATLVIGVVMGTALDLVASYNNIWTLGIQTFPIKILGVLPIDHLFWWVASMYFVFTYYEHFIANNPEQEQWTPSKKLIGLALVSFIILGAISFGILNNWEILTADFFYLKMAAILVLPSLLLAMLKYKKTFWKLFLWSIPFFLINLVIEVAGIHLGHWSFVDDYLYTIHFLGTDFPIEEVIFWMVLGTSVLFAWYRAFVDRAQES